MTASTAAELRQAFESGHPVMSGHFADYNAQNVLRVLSISRQFTCVELRDIDQTVVAYIYIKAGMVLAVDAPALEASGLDAFDQLMRAPLGSYSVHTLAPLATYPFPLARLSSQLVALERDAEREPRASNGHRVDSHARESRAAALPTVSAEGNIPPAPNGANRTPIPLASPPSDVSPATTAPFRAPRSTSRSHPVEPAVVAIASPKGGCGKTTIALNLAVSLARQGLRIVLVDVDPNGDVLSAVAGRERVSAGVYEALLAGENPRRLLLQTMVPGLQIMPAMGPELRVELLETQTTVEQWRGLFHAIGDQADIILVDTPAGVLGATATVLKACTHVIGVLQAEVIAKRSFPMFARSLASLATPPAVLGVVLNMFQRSQSVSVSVFTEATDEMPAEWIFDTTIPRATDFLSSSHAGMPLRAMNENAPSAVTWLFDMLGGEVRARLGIGAPASEDRASSFIL